MYKIVVIPVRTGEEEIVFANDFEIDDVKLAMYQCDDNNASLTFLLHAIESFYVEHMEENNVFGK